MIFNYKDDTIIINGRRERKFREIEILELISSKYVFNNSIIDCGANYGNHTIYLAKYTDCSQVFSFEPIPNIHKTLEENIIANNIVEKVTSYNAGVSRKEKDLKLISFIDDTQGAFWFWYKGEDFIHPADMGYGHLHRKSKPVQNLTVKSVALDSKIAEFGKVDFVKIDVEGMEMEVLLGASEVISKNRPLLYVEACRGTENLVRDWVDKNNYHKVRDKHLYGHHWLLEPKEGFGND